MLFMHSWDNLIFHIFNHCIYSHTTTVPSNHPKTSLSHKHHLDQKMSNSCLSQTFLESRSLVEFIKAFVLFSHITLSYSRRPTRAQFETFWEPVGRRVFIRKTPKRAVVSHQERLSVNRASIWVEVIEFRKWKSLFVCQKKRLLMLRLMF